MKKVASRAWAVLVLSGAIFLGLLIFAFTLAAKGGSWVTFPSNRHLYSGGVLTEGWVLDRNGTVLWAAEDGKSVFSKDRTVRKATLHAVGDEAGNIATSAKVAFAGKLTGWDLLNGTFRAGGGGNDLYLTLDAGLCKTAYQALGSKSGAVGVYNYRTGEILCMVSTPSFDPKNPPEITENNQDSGMYLNRFLSAFYTPGSVFKLVTAAAAIDCIPDIESRTFTCTGSLVIGDGVVTCPEAHGTLDFQTALADSCNTAFAQISAELGAGVLEQYARKAFFGSGVTVSGIGTASGHFSLAGASQNEIAWSGIGQFTDLASPCAFLTYVGAIANSGVPVMPRLISKVTTQSGFPAGLYFKHTGRRALSETTASALADMMRYDVTENYGADRFPGLDLCAKSGTAEVGGGKGPNAWFAGFLRNEDAPLAFVVVVEDGGSGVGTASPIANKVLQAAVKLMEAK